MEGLAKGLGTVHSCPTHPWSFIIIYYLTTMACLP